MMTRIIIIDSAVCYYFLLLFLLLFPGEIHGLNNEKKKAIVKQVLTYIQNHDPIEKFDNTERPLRVQKTLVIDIGGDKRYEVFLAIKPYFHQTPPIFIYQVIGDGAVVRLNEALAPGPLEWYDDSYYNAHKTGKAADMSIKGALPGERLLLIANYLRMRSHVVEYSSFSHVEHAGDSGYYVDLRTQSNRFEPLKDKCSDIQFATIDDLVFGKVNQNGPDLLLVSTGKTLNIYQINGLDRMGLLRKKSMLMPLPDDFISFSYGETGLIGYRSLVQAYNPLFIRLQLLQ